MSTGQQPTIDRNMTLKRNHMLGFVCRTDLTLNEQNIKCYHGEPFVVAGWLSSPGVSSHVIYSLRATAFAGLLSHHPSHHQPTAKAAARMPQAARKALRREPNMLGCCLWPTTGMQSPPPRVLLRYACPTWKLSSDVLKCCSRQPAGSSEWQELRAAALLPCCPAAPGGAAGIAACTHAAPRQPGVARLRTFGGLLQLQGPQSALWA